jgi:hypothetical protein
MDVPLTGTTVGDLYAGQKSGVDEHPGRQRAGLLTQRPGQRRGPDGVGHGEGGLGAHGEPRGMDRHAADRLRLPVAALRSGLREHPRRERRDLRVAAADGNAKLRVVVSAGNWVSSVSQAASALTAGVPKAAASKSSASKSSRLAPDQGQMSPRRFAVSHKRKRRGTRLDGSRITWKLNQAATVRLTIQRRGGSAKHGAGCGSAR